MLVKEILVRYGKALTKRYTYDIRRNPYLWFGFVWGLPIPVLSIGFDLTYSGVGAPTPFQVIATHPLHLLSLAHPFFFAIFFGGVGTLRREQKLEEAHHVTELEGLAMTDPLTGLYNRRYLMEELENMLSRAHRSGQPFMVLMFDVDGFKAINDRWGHPFGDRVLRKVAQTLQRTLRRGEILGRYGGDEFILLVAGDHPSALDTVDRAIEAVRQETNLSVSVGLAHWPRDGKTPEDLIHRADAFLADRKRKRREEQSVAC